MGAFTKLYLENPKKRECVCVCALRRNFAEDKQEMVAEETMQPLEAVP